MTLPLFQAPFQHTSFLIKDFPHWQIRLMNDKRFPWVLVIPNEPIVDFHEWEWEKTQRLLKFIYDLSAAMKHEFQAHKMNMATIGNVVPQLHYHLIARFTDDDLWPKHVWGNGTAELYEQADMEIMIKRLLRILPD